jgi:hypothetical protein
MASNVTETRTLIRSAIDALRGTPSTAPIKENGKEDSSEPDPEAGQEGDFNQLNELGGYPKDSREIRYASKELLAPSPSISTPGVELSGKGTLVFVSSRPAVFSAQEKLLCEEKSGGSAKRDC